MDDATNTAIWNDSPALQRLIQPPHTLIAPGSIGAQQAMIDGDAVLPWVPDILGERWRDPDAVLVVGSAYAGFIRELSGRNATMPLAEYRHALDWRDFQGRFMRYVVTGDTNYYGPVMQLVGDPHRVALFDLCRASFVKRGDGATQRTDEAGDSVVRQATAQFASYVDRQDDWTWERNTSTRANRIIALGTIAEHGLLRLFSRRNMTITCASHVHRIASALAGRWTQRYADPTRTLGYWLKHKCWWTVQGILDGQPREWRLFPAFHPARSADRGYTRTAEVLAAMR